MYAEHRYAPRQSRVVSLGGAFLINGAIIGGMLFYLAPQFVPKEPPVVLTTTNVPIPPEPKPIEEPEPRPTSERVPTTPPPHAPPPRVPTASDNPVVTTPVIYEPVLPRSEPNPGPTYVPEATPPLPPLLTAVRDPRFARDFQPPYPAAELRAQRSGVVQIKVLIGTDGRVKAAEPISATSDAFFESTRRQALSKWRFKPATRGGVPQEMWKTLSVRFTIEDQ